MNDVRRALPAERSALKVDTAGDATTLRTALRAILVRVPGNAVVIPHPVPGNAHALEVTTRKNADARPFTLLHPIGDLLEGRGRMTPEQLITIARGHVTQAKLRGDATFRDAGRVLEVVAPWRVQEALADGLDALRAARRVDRAAPLR